MMTAKEFRDTIEWHRMRQAIVEEMIRVTEACIMAPDMNQKEYNRGYADAFRTVLMLPDSVLQESDEPEEKLLEEDGSSLATILISNRPKDGGVW